ncbi:MAG: glycosyltransferase [Gammaproteobacteria bacterium]|nr:glycosyltransferase [Gammaproteobacteria bacterium]
MSEKIKKVAIVYHCIAHYRGAVFQELCKSDAGVQYTLITGESDCIPSLKTVDIEKSKIPVEQGGLRWKIVRNHWFKKKVLWQQGVVSLGLSKEYDAIIYLGVAYHISTWLSCIFARLTGKKTYMWSHGFLRKEEGLKGWLRGTFYGLCDGMLLYHHRARELLLDRGFAPEKLDVLYNSLDVAMQKKVRDNIQSTELDDLRTKLFSSSPYPILLWIGRLTSQKKLDMIIKAAAELDSQDFHVNLLFVGDGPEREALEQEVQQQGLEERVCFYGASHNEEELGPLISLSDICVAPGEVGLTCMHSLVYGTPVLTHNNPDYQMPEYEAIQPGVSGEFFEYGDTPDLAITIRKWLTQNKSRNDIRDACYSIIDNFYNPWNQVNIINNMILGNDSTLIESKSSGKKYDIQSH